MSRLPDVNDDRRGEDLEEARQPGGWGDLAQAETDRAAVDDYERDYVRRWAS